MCKSQKQPGTIDDMTFAKAKYFETKRRRTPWTQLSEANRLLRTRCCIDDAKPGERKTKKTMTMPRNYASTSLPNPRADGHSWVSHSRLSFSRSSPSPACLLCRASFFVSPRRSKPVNMPSIHYVLLFFSRSINKIKIKSVRRKIPLHMTMQSLSSFPSL